MNRFGDESNKIRRKISDVRPVRGKSQEATYVPPEAEHVSKRKEALGAENFGGEEIIITETPESGAEDFLNREEVTHLQDFSRKRRSVRLGIISGVLALFLVLGLVSTVFSRVIIRVKPAVEQVSLPDTLIALDTSVSRILREERVVPAQRLEFSRKITRDFESTGKKFVEEKARGKVRIYNGFSSAPQILAKDTRFLTEEGLLFRLPQSLKIPGAEVAEGKIVPRFLETELIANLPGEEANLSGEVRLKIPGFKGTPKYENFYAIAERGFAGGFRGEAKVVSSEDRKRAEEELKTLVREAIRQEISLKIPPNFKRLDSLTKVEVIKFDLPGEGARSERFQAGAEARAKVLIFRESDIESFMRELVLSDKKSQEYVEGSAKFNYRLRAEDLERGRAEVVIYGDLKARKVIPVGELAEAIRGQKEGSLIEILKRRDDLAAFSVAFFPPWKFSAPHDLGKIKIKVEK